MKVGEGKVVDGVETAVSTAGRDTEETENRLSVVTFQALLKWRRGGRSGDALEYASGL